MKPAVVRLSPLGVVLPFRFGGVRIQHGGLECQAEHRSALPCSRFGIAKRDRSDPVRRYIHIEGEKETG